MPINPLVSDKISNLDVPDKIKEILKKILDAEDNLEFFKEQNYKHPIKTILTQYADEPDIKEFCKNYD